MKRSTRLLALAAVLPLSLLPAAADDAPPSGDSVIRGKAGPSNIVITTTKRLAGAIHSLTWNGKEFVDSADHGRQIQSASNLDCGLKMVPELFNPTEAGSVSDGAGPTSTSRLLELEAKGNELRTLTRMAFWLRPGEKSAGLPPATPCRCPTTSSPSGSASGTRGCRTPSSTT